MPTIWALKQMSPWMDLKHLSPSGTSERQSCILIRKVIIVNLENLQMQEVLKRKINI